ncbi:uncharacterized protein [Panulirus ornatus]|uniref:uncharacterized protein isoform X3 n=1 Tax=Panulirus ornatus TaxID=150431 RepID=UPI003A83F35F
MAEGMLSLSWNNHSSTFCHMLAALREVERYTDVTVACEGKFYPVHKLVLSTCSDYFSKMFESTPCKHPIIVLKDIQCKDVEALLSYMYAGIVSVAQSDLAQLIKAAELLQIKGLAVPDEPPTSNRRGRCLMDSSSSPHPKRHKRREPNHGDLHGGALFSPSSPRLFDDDQEENQMESQIAIHKSYQGDTSSVDDMESGQVDQGQSSRITNEANKNSENEAAVQDCSSSQVENTVEDASIKEELLDDESKSDMTDTGFNYGTLVPEVGVDSSEAGEDQPNLKMSGEYNEQCHDQSFLHHQFQQSENSSEAQPGPILLQAWQNLSEAGECSSGGQGYNRDMNQDTSLPVHLDSQSLYPMVQPNKEDQRSNTHGFNVVAKIPTSMRKQPQSQAQNQTTHGDTSSVQDPNLVREKPYSCTLCSFRTAYQSNLTAHHRTHTGERPFLCPYCPTHFARKSHLKQHLSTHTGERPYACHYCSYRSSRISYLKRHLETHTG